MSYWLEILALWVICGVGIALCLYYGPGDK